jgi:hypothetical protein
MRTLVRARHPVFFALPIVEALFRLHVGSNAVNHGRANTSGLPKILGTRSSAPGIQRAESRTNEHLSAAELLSRSLE